MAVGTTPNVYFREMPVFLMVLDVPKENQQERLPLALYYGCFGLIRKNRPEIVSTVAQKAGVTQFTIWFVPFPGLHGDSEMKRRYEVSHCAIL